MKHTNDSVRRDLTPDELIIFHQDITIYKQLTIKIQKDILTASKSCHFFAIARSCERCADLRQSFSDKYFSCLDEPHRHSIERLRKQALHNYQLALQTKHKELCAFYQQHQHQLHYVLLPHLFLVYGGEDSFLRYLA